MMNNILEQIKQKYSNLLVTDPEQLKKIGSWVSGDSLTDSFQDEIQVILDSPNWSAEILSFPRLNNCFISIRYKYGKLRDMKSLTNSECTIENVSKILEDKDMIKKATDYEKYYNQMLEPKRFDGDIVITDPAYIEDNHWSEDPDLDIYNGFGFDKVFGDTYIYGSTIYGDWSCTVYDCGNRNPKEIIEEVEKNYEIPEMPRLGNFCADAGLVSVTYLEKSENIKKYGDHCWTLIADFHGTVQYYQYHDSIYIIGISDDGIHNFVSFQTGA